jgi:hypothetical protein
MTVLTPLGALAALAALMPLAAWAAGRRRVERVRRVLGLPAGAGGSAVRTLAATGAVAVLGLAAAQPALTHGNERRVRANVEALFVFDTSRSMAASATPTAPTRLDRAVAAAIGLRDDIADVPSGVATLTDRVLPDLLPVANATSFDLVARRGVAIESPPPAGTDVRATTFDALRDIVSGNYFTSKATRRVVVLLTDGETNPVDTGELARVLDPARGYRFLALRFWSGDESVFDRTGKVEPAYRPDPLGRVALDGLADALGGRAFEEGDLDAAASYLRGAAETGPTTAAPGTEATRTPLAPYIAALALLLLLVGVAPPLPVSGRRVQSGIT